MNDLLRQLGVKSVSRFDRRVFSILLGMVVLIGLTILMGDHVGVRLIRFSPPGTAHSTSQVVIQFDETMDRPSVESRFHIDPHVDGLFSWNSETLVFQPKDAFLPGNTYIVTLDAGARSESGRSLLDSKSFSFTVQPPRVAYLAPATIPPINIWVADPGNPDSARQLTFSTVGIFDYSVSPNGSQIAFSEPNRDTNTIDIKILNLESNTVRQVTNCQDSDCSAPVWRPDGRAIAYERVDHNSPLPSIGVSPTRIWLVDLTANPPSTNPMFNDSQQLGYGAAWSADGNRIAFYDSAVPGIKVYDFTTQNLQTIPSGYGSTGALSPDGTRLVFADTLIDNQGSRSYLQLASLADQSLTRLSAAEDASADDSPTWNPDGEFLAFTRRYLDGRYTRGPQVYMMYVQTREVEPLVLDERYANGALSWDPTGTQLVIQRFPELDAQGQPNSSGLPEIWTYDIVSGALTRVASNAYMPRWVP